MKLQIPFHKIILITLVNFFPKTFARYHREYQEVMEQFFTKKEKC